MSPRLSYQPGGTGWTLLKPFLLLFPPSPMTTSHCARELVPSKILRILHIFRKYQLLSYMHELFPAIPANQ